jgi:hypothetical protein
MGIPDCKHERLIVEAVRRGHWPESSDPALVEHARKCEVCRDALTVAQFLQTPPQDPSQEVRLPAAELVWWKAQLKARREAAERAARPVSIAEYFSLACGLACLLGFALWKWSSLRGWLGQMRDLSLTHTTWFPNFLSHLFAQPTSLVFVAAVSLLVVLMVCLAYGVWTEK